MLGLLAPMTQLNSKLDRLLSQRSFSPLRKLCNLCDRRPRLRVCPQLSDIHFGVFAAHRLLRLGRLLFCFFRQLLFLEFVSGLTTISALRSNLHQTCVEVRRRARSHPGSTSACFDRIRPRACQRVLMHRDNISSARAVSIKFLVADLFDFPSCF
jgi:hypothetical protein